MELIELPEVEGDGCMDHLVMREEWVLQMWIETCKNFGAEIEEHPNEHVMRMRCMVTMTDLGLKF
jgi:hypothetical protein